MSASSKAIAAIGVLSVLVVASGGPADAIQPGHRIGPCCDGVNVASRTW